MTTTSAATPTSQTATPAAAQAPPRRDTEGARLRAAVQQFTDADVDDTFPQTRVMLARLDEVERAFTARRRAADDLERELVDRLVAGADVDAIAVELAATSVPRLAEVGDRAARTLRRQATQSAAREATAAHTVLCDLVASAVADAVDAANRCADCTAISTAIATTPDFRAAVGTLVADAPTSPDWPAATRATRRVTELRQLADVIADLGGPASRFWSTPRPIGEAGLVAETVPEPLVLAVATQLGWAPGLTAIDPTPSPPDAVRQARQDAATQAGRWAPLAGAVDRLTGRS